MSPFGLMGCKLKKQTEKRKKNCVKIARYTLKSEVPLDFYSINLCGSPVFYHQNQNQRKQVRLFTLTFPAEKCAFFCVVLYKVGKKMSP